MTLSRSSVKGFVTLYSSNKILDMPSLVAIGFREFTIKTVEEGGTMKRIGLCIVAIALLVFGTATMGEAQDALKSAVADIESGWQKLDIGLLEKSVTYFAGMAKKDPKDYQAPYYEAKAHFAIADCLDIKSPEEFDKTGEGDPHIDKALELIKAAQKLKEDNVDIYILKFQIIRRKMLHVSFPGLMMYVADRTATYDKAKELAPDNMEVQIISAIQVAEGGWPPPPPEKPIAEFEKLLQKNPKLAEAHYQIGDIWKNAKKVDDAKKHFAKALELNPNHHWAKKKLKSLESGTGT
jgi:tetratricopeptide (TPR) repeat protein